MLPPAVLASPSLQRAPLPSRRPRCSPSSSADRSLLPTVDLWRPRRPLAMLRTTRHHLSTLRTASTSATSFLSSAPPRPARVPPRPARTTRSEHSTHHSSRASTPLLSAPTAYADRSRAVQPAPRPRHSTLSRRPSSRPTASRANFLASSGTSSARRSIAARPPSMPHVRSRRPSPHRPVLLRLFADLDNVAPSRHGQTSPKSVSSISCARLHLLSDGRARPAVQASADETLPTSTRLRLLPASTARSVGARGPSSTNR